MFHGFHRLQDHHEGRLSRHIMKQRRRWSKLHDVIYVNDLYGMSIFITDYHLHDNRKGKRILENTMGEIKRIFDY